MVVCAYTLAWINIKRPHCLLHMSYQLQMLLHQAETAALYKWRVWKDTGGTRMSSSLKYAFTSRT